MAVTLQLKNVAFRYQKRELFHSVNAEVTSGAIQWFAGPNGAGKSTMLKLLSGFLRPTAGEILWNDTPLPQISSNTRSRLIGVIAQTPPPVLDFSVWELLLLSCQPLLPCFGEPAPEILDRIRQAARVFELNELLRKPANEISGGELSRVRLAGMAALAPEILLADEPTSALDPGYRNLAVRWLKTYAQTHIVVVVTHDLELLSDAQKLWLLGKEGDFYAGDGETLLSEKLLTKIYHAQATVEARPNGRKRIAFDPVG